MPQSMRQNPERIGGEQTIEITAEFERHHSNCKQNLAEKEYFDILKFSEKQPLFGKCSLSSHAPKTDNQDVE